MATFPVTQGARLLGIHPKTLHHWLTAAEFPLAAHPTDARLKCVAEEHLLELARQHGRPLATLSSVPALESDTASAFAEEHVKPLPAHEGELAHRAAVLSAPAAALADLLQQLAQLHTQVASLQHHLTWLTLAFLQEQTGRSEHWLRPLDGRLSQTLESLQPSQQTDVAGPLAPSPRPERRLLPVEVRARSRVTALIEYGAQGQYVAVCPRLGVLSLVPDSPQWLDWLAQLASFRGCRASRTLFGVSCLRQRAVHPPLGCPERVSWTLLVALSRDHRPLNARLVGTGSRRPASSGGRALSTCAAPSLQLAAPSNKCDRSVSFRESIYP